MLSRDHGTFDRHAEPPLLVNRGAAMEDHLTVGEVAKLYSVQTWHVRRVVDRLGADIPRAGGYRLIPRTLLGDIYIALRERGLLPGPTATTCDQRAS